MRKNDLVIGTALSSGLVLGLAIMITHANAFGQAGRMSETTRPAFHGGFGHPPHQGFARRKTVIFGAFVAPYGGLPYDSGNVPLDAFGDTDSEAATGTGAAAAPANTVACQRSVETTTVPSENGGTRQIKVIRCP